MGWGEKQWLIAEIEVECPTMLHAINVHVLHCVFSNHAFTDIEQSTGKALLQPLPQNQKERFCNALAPSLTAEQVQNELVWIIQFTKKLMLKQL